MTDFDRAEQVRGAIATAITKLRWARDMHLKTIAINRPATQEIIHTIDLQIDDLTHILDYAVSLKHELQPVGGAL